MEKLAAHPSRQELSAYSLGQLPEEVAVAIDSHISECEPCCETIVELSSEDTFAGLLQEAGRLPMDQTADHSSATSKSTSDPDDIPPPLNEHPRYEVLGLIGKGGMGDVYKARHRKMERTVALKVINRGLVRKAEAVDRFHREVKAAAQLSHSNIVTAYDADHTGDFHFMVMEFVDGVDLSQTIKDRGALPIAEACDYVRQAALGLQHAHERGMVHRDIKPHNLMVTADGTVKILDFGLASLAPEASEANDSDPARSDLTAAGAIMGTPDFISPEQAYDARQVDIRSDIYSLGATLYYLLSGRVPFDDGSVMQKLRSHAQVEPVPLNSVREDVPEELMAVASKMMAKDPDERYLTPKEVADALESFLRTWRPNEANSQGQLSLGGGNNIESGGKFSGAGDAIWKWLLAFATVLIFGGLAAGLYYIGGNLDGIRDEVTAPEDVGSLGTHPLTIVDTSGKKPLGGTTGTHQDDASGIATHFFESANGRYNITLVDKVLTVNGERYTLENLTDAIRIVDDRVEITQVTALPSKPELKITGKTTNKGTSGLPSVYDWNFKGRDVGELKVRLLLAQNGKTEVIQEFDFEEIPTKYSNKVRLEVRDDATGADRKRRVNATLFVEYPAHSRGATVNEDRGLSIDVDAPFRNNIEQADLERIEPGQTELLLALSYWKGDMTHDLSIESMTAATKDGNATFLFVTLDWSPAISDVAQLQGDWETEWLIESGKQLAAKDGFGGLLLQIKGDAFVIAERKPDGEKTEVDSGRIEINSAATIKTIDLIGRAERRLGIYELKHGVLRVCLVEYGGTDNPRGERIPDGNPVTRPTTFESKPGSNTMLMEFQRAKPDENVTRQSVEPSFSYDLSQVPGDMREIYGYRPRQFRKDGRFKRMLESLDHSAPNKFLMDQNLEQVLNLQWANDDRTYSQPLIVLTVIDGTAMEFASRHLGVRVDGANSEVTHSKYFPIEQGKFLPMAAEQFVRFVDEKTLILSCKDFLDAHQIALKEQPNTEILRIAASMPDALLWMISNTSDKDYVEQIKFRYSQSPLAAVLMTQLPIWEDTNYLTLSLVVGEDPNLQLAAHAPAADLQYEITQTVRTLPVTLANLLRPFSDGSGPADAKTIDALIGALRQAQVTQPSGTESRLTIPLKVAEPHLLRLLNSWFVDLEQAKSAAYKAASVSNLRQISLAFQFFEQEHGYLPSVTTKLPGAKHPVSWRVAILKYLDEKLYSQYNLNEPWDSENNKNLLEELPSFYRHPGQEKGISNTCYVTLVGDNTATGDGKSPVSLVEDISDGSQQTIWVTEGFTHIPWTKPEDLQFDDETTLPPVHPHPDGWNVIFADGAAHFVPSETSVDVLRALITRSGGEMIENENGVWKMASESNENASARITTGDVDQYERLFQLRVLLLRRSLAILDSIKDEASAEKAAASWRTLFPMQVEAEYLEGRLVEFSDLDGRRADAREKYGSQVDELRRMLRKRQAECQKLPFFQKVNRVQQEYSEDLLSVAPFEIRNGHAWRADGPQFVIWFPPRVIPEIDLSGEKGTLEVLIVDEDTGALRPQREHIQCGGEAVLPLQDEKHGCLYWLRPV